jgi:hypothetical protein
MMIWKYTPDSDHFQSLSLVDHKEDGYLFHEDNFRLGKPFPEPLPTISVVYEKELKEMSPPQRRLARQGKLPRGEFPSLYGIEVIFTERALKVLLPLIQNSVQVIPLQCEEDDLYLIHVIDVLDCLDMEHSEIERLSDGSIFRILHYELKNLEALEGKGFFRMEGLPLEFVTDDFRALVEENDLQGLIWNPLP